jgi:hypothetical protein
MQAITGITDAPVQVFNVNPGDGTTATVTLAFRPQQLGWFIDVLWNGKTPALEINGRRVTAYPNLLRQFKNVLSFGIGCVTQDNYEPLGQGDFASGYATLLLLSQADIASIEAAVFPGNLAP